MASNGTNREGYVGLSADCKLDPTLAMIILMEGREHPCERCNTDRRECRGFPRRGSTDAADAAGGNDGTGT